jgi:hypothetical protein
MYSSVELRTDMIPGRPIYIRENGRYFLLIRVNLASSICQLIHIYKIIHISGPIGHQQLLLR